MAHRLWQRGLARVLAWHGLRRRRRGWQLLRALLLQVLCSPGGAPVPESVLWRLCRQVWLFWQPQTLRVEVAQLRLTPQLQLPQWLILVLAPQLDWIRLAERAQRQTLPKPAQEKAQAILVY